MQAERGGVVGPEPFADRQPEEQSCWSCGQVEVHLAAYDLYGVERLLCDDCARARRFIVAEDTPEEEI